jgi:hypothetical protein
MALTESLLNTILQFCSEEGMTERQFGLTVANNHKLITRLRAGFGVNSQTHDRIMTFIETRKRARAANDIRKSKSKRATRSAGAAATPTSSSAIEKAA